MKTSKKLKLILIILICVLISLIGMVGIYSKKGMGYKNILPNYNLASDLKGTTILEFEVDESKETVYYDKEGKKIDSSEVTDENKKDYTSEEVPVNEPEILNAENYKVCRDILKERLNFLNADQYQLDLDETTGKIALYVEDDYIEDIRSILPMEGKLEVIDVNTGDVIIDNTCFKSVESSYAALENNAYQAYITLALNETGIEKINNIEKYKTTVSEDGKATTNNVNILFDTDKIAEVSYDKLLLINKDLRIVTDDNLKTESEINSKLNTNAVISKLATMGKLPVIYNLTSEIYINANQEIVEIIIIALAGICVGIFLFYILKYKTNGILAIIASLANISLFLILIRLTNIQISLNGLVGMFILIVLNTILVLNILKAVKDKENAFSENIKKAYIKTIDVFAIVLIIFVVFAFSSMSVINSMGLLVFWGWLLILLGNLIFTVPMLSYVDKK